MHELVAATLEAVRDAVHDEAGSSLDYLRALRDPAAGDGGARRMLTHSALEAASAELARIAHHCGALLASDLEAAPSTRPVPPVRAYVRGQPPAGAHDAHLAHVLQALGGAMRLHRSLLALHVLDHDLLVDERSLAVSAAALVTRHLWEGATR